ncbi:MAG: hypothetical protein AUH81_06540 [Candidatus Rokubacteria bacterium 13_1_40CM_4_69_5]|nr:MAG: hypothetical protein AUH81_06540 [Candidatus Rokubacteria bacterium 13_1_40CM_4_69_5]
MSSLPRPDWRRAAFAWLVIVCTAGAVGYAAWAVHRSRSGGRQTAAGPVAVGDAAAGRALIARSGATLMFQNEVGGADWSQVALVPLAAPAGPRTVVPLQCLRLYFAGGRGLCMAQDPGPLSAYSAYVFGPDFKTLGRISLRGLPSRARVSPDGRYGATTVFVTGHSYAAAFSTETLLIDLTSGARLGNLEEFVVLRDGHPSKASDFNFWGVTFARDGNRFYATLGTRGQTYLVEGDVTLRQLRVLRANVECPSLSPDGTRLAFKKRVGGGFGAIIWRFHVLDLATMTETPLAESRSIDDQIEWLDDGHVLYAIAPDVWTVPADGSGEPRPFLRRALSPAVIRAATTASAPSPTAARILTLPASDVAVTLSAAPNPVRVGEDLTYVVAVRNHGPAPATDVGIDLHLSPGVTFGAFGRASPPRTPHGCSHQRGYVSCTVFRLSRDENWTLQFTVRPMERGPLQTRVTVSGAQPDPNAGNDSATVAITVVAHEGALHKD